MVILLGNALMGRFRPSPPSESVRLVRVRCGKPNGRPGAVCLNFSKVDRPRPLQRPKVPGVPGIQVVPRKVCFRPELIARGFFVYYQKEC